MDKLSMAVGGMIVAGVLLIGFAFVQTGNAQTTLEKNEQNFQQFKALENTNDKCAVPPGQDPVKWREHLGHHPDLYGDCFK